MKRKLLSICIALVLALSLCLVTAVPVAAQTTINVPTDFSTIQEAIDAAGPDYIISVATGTYVGDFVIPDTHTNLELVGAEGAVIKGVATELNDLFPLAVPNIDILASGVKIHGFTIEGPASATDKYASGMLIGASNVEIYDNDFKVPTPATGHYSVAIQTYRKTSGGFGDIDLSGLSIHDNTFDDLDDGVCGYDGIFINIDTGTGLVSIVDNDFVGNMVRAISVERSNVVIGGNSIITDLPPDGPGTGSYQGIFIGCFELTLGLADGPEQSNVSVTGNTVKGFDAAKGFVQGIRVGHSSEQIGFSDITVSQNTVQYNTDGIVVKARTGATPVSVLINYNNIVANTGFGVNNATIDNAPINATLNWWGTIVETEIMAKVNGDVDYSIWLGAEYSPATVTMTGEAGEPMVTTGAATDVELYSATLHGNLGDMGGASTVDVYFEYGETQGGPYSSQIAAGSFITAPSDFSAGLTLLTPATTYYFRAKAVVEVVLIVYGSEESFTTLTEQIGITVAPTSIDFGIIPLGQSAGPDNPVTVTNTGDVIVDLDASIENESVTGFYANNLTIGGSTVAAWEALGVPITIGVSPGLVLSIPLGATPGVKTATLVFWAIASGP